MSDVLSDLDATRAVDPGTTSPTDELTEHVAAALSTALGEALDHGPAAVQSDVADLLPAADVRCVAATSNGETTHLVVVLTPAVADRLGAQPDDWAGLLEEPFNAWASQGRVAVERTLALDANRLDEALPRRAGLVLTAAGLFHRGEHVGSVATLARGTADPMAPAAAEPAATPDDAALPGAAAAAPQPGTAAPTTATTAAAAAPRTDGPIHFLADVEMSVTAELGRCRMAVAELLALTPGSVIELDRPAGGPIDLLVNGTLIARGEVVVIDEEFGVRITEIVGRED